MTIINDTDTHVIVDHVLDTHTVTRMMPVDGKGGWDNPVFNLETLRIEASTPALALRFADQVQYEEKVRLWGSKPKWVN